MDPKLLQSLIKGEAPLAADGALPEGVLQTTDIRPLQPSRSRLARRLYVSNPSGHSSLEEVLGFFVEILSDVSLSEKFRGDEVILDSRVVGDVFYLEFATEELTNIAYAYTDTPLSETEPQKSTFNIERPEGFIVPEKRERPSELSAVERQAEGQIFGPHALYMSNIPTLLGEEHLTELIKQFGEVREWRVIKDKNGQSKGVMFFEYGDSEVTTAVLDALKDFKLGENEVKVGRLFSGLRQSRRLADAKVSKFAYIANDSTPCAKSRIMQVLNAIMMEELTDPNEVADVKEQMRLECEKFGPVVNVEIPTTVNGAIGSSGRVFVKFEDVDDCKAAVRRLGGRKFTERTILTGFYPERDFDLGAF
jgi:splicing factor U2AF subunit